MQRQIKKDSTNISVDVFIIDATDGTPETGVVFNTPGIDFSYRRDFNFVVPITEIDLTTPDLEDAHEDGGFLAIGFGLYRLDVPDLAFATGASKVTITGTVTGMIVMPVEIQLVDFDPDDATRMGLTALPAAAADGVGGLPISDAGGLDMDAILADTNGLVADDIPSALAAIDILIESIIAAVITNAAGVDVSADIAALKVVADAIPTTAMRGTDSAALASVWTVARAGALTDWIDGGRLDLIIDTLVAAVITNAAGADVAADIIALKAVADAIPTTAMRGTDSAALASVWTVARAGALTDWIDGGRLDLLQDAIKVATDALPVTPKKNVALSNVPFKMVDETDHVTPETGRSVTGTISQDGGAFTALTNAEAEIANGWYKVDVTQAEMNADIIILKFTASGADQTEVVIFTDA